MNLFIRVRGLIVHPFIEFYTSVRFLQDDSLSDRILYLNGEPLPIELGPRR